MRAPSPLENATFQALCAPLDAVERAALRAAVQRHLLDLRQTARTHELLPVDLAEVLAARIDALLGQLDDPGRRGALDPDHVPLVVGAARNFVSDDDAIPDREGVLGLDDDVAVFNAVAVRVGRPDLRIQEPTA